ncbi:unnamed protein product [Phytophthora lilii]|uniref:Unnamed protein product n=1 Tax=Phytophthora lilii TaxID=2077276 RepID=A0A9W6TLA3_9STRA|nr:unnamed protein product [Phytophthora lilii]
MAAAMLKILQRQYALHSPPAGAISPASIALVAVDASSPKAIVSNDLVPGEHHGLVDALLHDTKAAGGHSRASRSDQAYVSMIEKHVVPVSPPFAAEAAQASAFDDAEGRANVSKHEGRNAVDGTPVLIAVYLVCCASTR